MTSSRRAWLQLLVGGAASAGIGLRFLWSRDAFLRDVKDPDNMRVSLVRPPTALSEKEFLGKCIRCNQCAEVCLNDCIRFVSGTQLRSKGGTQADSESLAAAEGTPYIVPRQQPCIL